MGTEMNVEAERAAFEKWAESEHENLGGEFAGPGKSGWYYWDDLAAAAWEAWLAARRAAQPADVGAGQVPQAAQGVKTWQERYNEMGTGPSFNDKSVAMLAEIDDLRAQLAHKAEAARRWKSKLDAVWADLCRVIEKHAGKPVDGEPLDALDALLARQRQGVPVAWMVDFKRAPNAKPDRAFYWKYYPLVAEHVAVGDKVTPLYAAPPLSSEPQTGLVCWSCKRQYTKMARINADGHCPHCGVEIEEG